MTITRAWQSTGLQLIGSWLCVSNRRGTLLTLITTGGAAIDEGDIVCSRLEKSQGPARFSKGVYHANHLTQGFCSYRSGLRDVFSRVQRHRAVGYRRWISQDTVSETSLTCSKICLRCRCDAEGADMRAPRAAQLYMDIAVEHTRKPRLPSSF